MNKATKNKLNKIVNSNNLKWLENLKPIKLIKPKKK